VAEEKPIKGFSPTGFFWSPSRRKAAKQLPFVKRRFFAHFEITTAMDGGGGT